MRFRIAFAAVLVVWAYLWWDGRPVDQTPGVLAPDAPVQIDLDEEKVVRRGDLVIAKIAHFDMTARVLATERYRVGREADIAPYDFVFGWGRMSDASVLEKISITQRSRFYYWSTQAYPIPREEIISSSANMHLIPATEEVRQALGGVRRGQIVRIDGYLVRVTAPDGWRWNTSTTRTDSGKGACELVWVETLEIT